MFVIQEVTDAPLQRRSLILPDGSSISLVIYFRPMQFGWFIKELTYNSFVLRELRITNSPNMLYQFKNQLPFGLACFSKGNREPSQQSDFISGASTLYVLTSEEVVAYSELLANG